MVDELDDFDLDEDLDLEDPTDVEGESGNRPEFGTEDEDLDIDLDEDEEEEGLTEEEVLRRAMEDELEEAEGQ